METQTGIALALLKLVWNRGPVPFLSMLERQGLTFTQVEELVGMNELGRAVRRCADCAGRWDCGRRAVDCPNEPLFRRVKGLVGDSLW